MKFPTRIRVNCFLIALFSMQTGLVMSSPERGKLPGKLFCLIRARGTYSTRLPDFLMWHLSLQSVGPIQIASFKVSYKY